MSEPKSRPFWGLLNARVGMVVVTCAALAACGRSPENAAADEKVLCDPTTGDAYFVRPGAGDSSFIRPHEPRNPRCKKE